ncbi:MAG TPA: inositol 2-dehydrogenase [Anaerolineaceae bacterium]|nr:inositol 2-dehydrogenase [Anaerolineaceae bacterium]
MGIRIGLIGAGRMGKVFANTLAFTVSEVDLVAVADPNEEALNEVSHRYNIQAKYKDYRALLDSKDVEAVVITSPTGTHADVICAAAAAGKDIFSEKPLSQDLAQCDRAIAAVKQAGVKLQMGFMRRFDPPYAAAKRKILEGVIGKPVMFKGTSRDPMRTSLEFAKRENSGGLIVDMGVHDFDLARWLMDSEVTRVYCEGAALAFPELKEVGDIDNVVVNLRFANEAVGNIDMSRNAVYGYDIRTEVLGSEGSLWIGYLKQTPTLVLTRNGVTHDTVPYFMERFGIAYAEEVRVFVRHILENTTPTVSGEDARAATAIGIAATRSLDEERPVLVSEVEIQ